MPFKCCKLHLVDVDYIATIVVHGHSAPLNIIFTKNEVELGSEKITNIYEIAYTIIYQNTETKETLEL